MRLGFLFVLLFFALTAASYLGQSQTQETQPRSSGPAGFTGGSPEYLAARNNPVPASVRMSNGRPTPMMWWNLEYLIGNKANQDVYRLNFQSVYYVTSDNHLVFVNLPKIAR